MCIIKTDFYQSIRPFVQDIHTDVLGNIIAHRKGRGKRIMLIAHQDVVRMMVTHIDNNGFLYIKPSGGIDVAIIPARKVLIRHGNQFIIGIVGKKPIHLQREESSKLSWDSLWVDIGVSSRKEALQWVELGDYVYFDTPIENLSGNLISGAYFDNKVGLSVLALVAERLNTEKVPWEIYFVASNLEEIGWRGAITASNLIKPDYCICVDVTHATDYPNSNVIQDGDIRLNAGCALTKGPYIDEGMFARLKQIAEHETILHQIELRPYSTTTEVDLVQIINEGVQCALVSIPCRYMHTPQEVVSTKDIEAAVDLITYYLLPKVLHINKY